jgi:hypothetical protein
MTYFLVKEILTTGPALDQFDHGVDVAAYGFGIRTRLVRGVHRGLGDFGAPNPAG